jgi:nitroimidazol reductase NimA-like FMN-containing flavoprotein (pyridoxamine 5'-phosphate oxidase superfamily)
MTTPATSLDPRYSQPDATATTWDETLRVIRQAELFWISTVRADGRPHVTPLVAVWLDGQIHFATGPDEQKGLNLRSNPHVVLMTGCNGWEEGLDVMVEGVAVRCVDDAVLSHLVTAWTPKWDGRWKWGVRDGAFRDEDDGSEVAVYSVTPTKVLAFGKGSFSHTRHVF